MSKIFVIVKKADHAAAMRRIEEKACDRWDAIFELYPVEERRNARKNNADPTAYIEETDRIVDKIGEGDYSLILLQKGVAVDKTRLEVLDSKCRTVNSLDALVKFIFDKLKKRKLYWQSHALNEWEKSSLKELHPDAWRQQFQTLNVQWVGTNLLKILRVVSNDELRAAFKIPRDNYAGLKVLHAYFRDPEPGSSSLCIRSILEHLYPGDTVVEYDPENLETLRNLQNDRIYLYEDGLWSGVELVRRLTSIFSSVTLQGKSCEFHFCYGVTCDAGLMAGNLFNKRVGMQNVQLRAAVGDDHYKLLRLEDELKIENLIAPSDDEVRRIIDEHIRPMAFQSDHIWCGRQAEALDICEAIGRQLVSSFLERRRQTKLLSENTGIPFDATAEDRSLRWALGALRFGSTVAFESSVPKPVLPLMWLQGKVILNGIEINWRPLFWDVRRTGAISYSDQAPLD